MCSVVQEARRGFRKNSLVGSELNSVYHASILVGTRSVSRGRVIPCNNEIGLSLAERPCVLATRIAFFVAVDELLEGAQIKGK